MTTLTARGVVTGAAMLQLIAEHAGMTERDFATGAYLDKFDPALDITARDIVTGAYVHKLNTADEPAPASLLLVPTGATESADGEYQRFVYDGTHTESIVNEGNTLNIPMWFAELPTQSQESEYQILVKMPDLTGNKSVDVLITDAAIDTAGLIQRGFNYLCLELRESDGSTGVVLNIADDQPNSTTSGLSQPTTGSSITLTLSTAALDYVWSGGSGSVPIPAGFFTAVPNVVAVASGETANDIAELSIQVLQVEQA